MENPVIIFGAGNLGRLAQDILTSNELLIYGFLDEKKELHGTEISDVVVLGDPFDDGFLKFIGQKTEACVAVDDLALRKKIVNTLLEKRKSMPVNAIHKNALISEDAQVSNGTLIGPGVIINAGTTLLDHVTIHSGAIIDPNCRIEEFTEIGQGARIGAEVEVGSGSFIGAGVVIVAGVKIGKNARVGAGSVVIANVSAGQTVFGNPASPIKS